MRALKFAKYLPEYGWRAVVLTAWPEDCYFRHEFQQDPGLLLEIEGLAAVHQVRSPLEYRARCIRAKQKALSKKLDAMLFGRSKDTANGVFGGPRGLGRFQGIRVHQDQSALWNPFAYRAARKLVFKEDIDAILTTSPPHLVHLVGYCLRLQTGIPWVADFRDGWCGNPVFTAASAVRRRVDQKLERRVVGRADAVVVVTNHMLEHFQRSYPERSGVFHLIRNGFDPADFVGRMSLPREPVTTFVHVGNLGGFRNPGYVVRAFDELVAEGCFGPMDVKLVFVGANYGDGSALASNLVELVPPVNHSKAIEYMMSADVLLLVAGAEEGPAAMTSKVFEYLASRRPILAAIPAGGELAQLLSSLSHCVVVPPNDLRRIKEGILEMRMMLRAGVDGGGCDREVIAGCDRRVLTGRLADLLNLLVSRGDRSGGLASRLPSR